MKFKIRHVEKTILPRYDNVSNQDESTLMVSVNVDFIDDLGEVVLNQTFALLPAEAKAEYFKKQADAMQADADHTAATKQLQEDSAVADQSVAELDSLIN